MRLLVLNADDFGLTAGISRGILRAGREGALTSTSVLANGRAFIECADALRDSGLHVGVHLALAGGDPPVLPASRLPSLAPGGLLPRDWRSFVWRFTARLIDPAEVRAELAAQIARVRGTGVHLTHLDSHQYLHLLPGVREIVIALAREHGVGVLGVPRSRRARALGGIVGMLATRTAERARRAGLMTPEDAAGFDEAGKLDAHRLGLAIDRLAAGSARTAVINLHPGEADDPARERYRWGYDWGRELDALRDPALRDRVARGGFTLAGYGALSDAREQRAEAS